MRGIALSILVILLVSCSFSRISDRFSQNVTTSERDGQTIVERQWLVRESGQPLLKITMESSVFSPEDLASLAETVAHTINYKLGIFHYEKSASAEQGRMVREKECIECTIHRF